MRSWPGGVQGSEGFVQLGDVRLQRGEVSLEAEALGGSETTLCSGVLRMLEHGEGSLEFGERLREAGSEVARVFAVRRTGHGTVRIIGLRAGRRHTWDVHHG